jgi:hypothetical protein
MNTINLVIYTVSVIYCAILVYGIVMIRRAPIEIQSFISQTRILAIATSTAVITLFYVGAWLSIVGR